MAKALRYKESDASLEANLALIDCHLPAPVHKSKYKFLKKFPKPITNRFYYCYECEVVLNFADLQEVTCALCNKNYKKKVMKQNGSYFIHVPITP